MTSTPDQPKTTTMPHDQMQRAHDLAPQMVEVLAGWIVCEGQLSAVQLGFRDRIKAAQKLREIFRAANRIVEQVIEGETGNAQP